MENNEEPIRKAKKTGIRCKRSTIFIEPSACEQKMEGRVRERHKISREVGYLEKVIGPKGLSIAEVILKLSVGRISHYYRSDKNM